MAEPSPNTPAYRAIALVGWVFLVVGVIGIVLGPRLLLVWVVLIGFGAPSAIRAERTWRASRGSRAEPNRPGDQP